MTALSAQFSITFEKVANTMLFTDASTYRSVNTRGIIKVTYTTDGTILYQHASWALAPANWVAPDIDGSTSDWTKTAIALPTDPSGAYLIEYQVYDAATPPTSVTAITRTYTFAYVAPEVVIDLAILCSTSELTMTDSTDYNAVIGGVSYTPTISRVKTLTKPAGSGVTITPLTWTDNGTTPAITIGGGSTAGTRIWTRTWQANVVSTLAYTLATWGTVEPTVYLTDTVYGDDNIFAQCDATVCALAVCFKNLLDRWIASLTTNFQYREDKRDTIIQVSGLWTELFLAERCGTATQTIIDEIQTALAGENCDCTTNDDEQSHVIVPWAAITGTGSGTQSTFTFTITSTDLDPTTPEGINGDGWMNGVSGDVFQKTGGVWVLKGNMKGATGAAGGDGAQTAVVLLNDTTEYPTPANTNNTAISYDFPIANSYFTWDNDFMMFVWDVKLGLNANGKTIRLTYVGTDILTYFTDDTPIAENSRLMVWLKVEPVNPVTQHLYVGLTRGGTPGEIIGPVVYRSHAADINSAQSVQLFGQSSVGTGGDITGDCMMVKLYHTDQTLVAGTIPMSVGRGLVAQAFIATEGQTAFVVTIFTANDYYIPLIDNVPQSQLVVTRSGQTFTYAPGLTAGQVLLIVD